jgi:hypothetical protein
MRVVEDLELVYRRIYRRLTVGMFVLYGIALAVAVTVLLSGPARDF